MSSSDRCANKNCTGDGMGTFGGKIQALLWEGRISTTILNEDFPTGEGDLISLALLSNL